MNQTNEPHAGKPRPSVNLELNLNAVIVPAQNAVELSSEIVDFFSDAIAKANLLNAATSTNLIHRMFLRQFVCKACGQRGADVSPDFHWEKEARPPAA